MRLVLGGCQPVNNWTYVYDGENRIKTAGSTSYTYDAAGRRIQKSSGTNYWYDPSGQVMAETDSSGTWTNYIFFAGQRLARNVNGDIKYFITDHLHSTGMFVDKAGTAAAILDDNDFYPWGGVVPGVGQSTSNNTIKFTGQYRDGESQLDYFGARYYSNGLGRWVSADWSATPALVPYAVFYDPQTLNLYGYVRGLPTTRMDADGHCDWCHDAVDFIGGVAKGIVASASGGAVGAPSSSDSNSSLFGQLLGTAIEGGVSTDLAMSGTGTAAVGLAAEIPSAGTSTVLVVAGSAAAAVGTTGAVGAAKNAGAVLHAMSARRQGDFKPSTREGAIQNNAKRNGGTNKCEECGQNLVRTQNKKGQAPPKNQLHVHHDPPIKDGGGKESKPKVVCRDCHQNKIHGKAEENR